MLDTSRNMRRKTREEQRVIGLRFVEFHAPPPRPPNYQQVAAWMERINLVRSEQDPRRSRASIRACTNY